MISSVICIEMYIGSMVGGAVVIAGQVGQRAGGSVREGEVGGEETGRQSRDATCAMQHMLLPRRAATHLEAGDMD